jgi:hypothetical protein
MDLSNTKPPALAMRTAREIDQLSSSRLITRTNSQTNHDFQAFSLRCEIVATTILPMVVEARWRDREARLRIGLPLVDWERRQ